LFVGIANEESSIEIKIKTNSAGCAYPVVILNGSPYGGQRDLDVDGDNYDGSKVKWDQEIHVSRTIGDACSNNESESNCP